MPRFSIITALKDWSPSFCEVIDCLNTQSFKDFEHIIIDGTGDWRVQAMCEEMCSYRFTLVEQTPRGIYPALNCGINESRGDILFFLHSDDIFATSSILELIDKAFSSRVDWVYGDIEFVKSKSMLFKRKIFKGRSRWLNSVYLGWCPPHTSAFVASGLMRQGFDENYLIASDYQFLTSLILKKVPSVYVCEVIVKQQIGGASTSGLKSLFRSFKEDLLIWRERKITVTGAVLICALKRVSKLSQFI